MVAIDVTGDYVILATAPYVAREFYAGEHNKL
jgi:hypothetical protein